MITDLDQALHFISSGDNHKCFDIVAEGTEEIALFLQDLSERGELFRVSAAPGENVGDAVAYVSP